MAKDLITESSIRHAVANGKKTLEVGADAIITPLARELASLRGVSIVEVSNAGQQSTRQQSLPSQPLTPISTRRADMIVVFGSDHGGFQLKEILKNHATSLGYKVSDVGTNNEDPCDYPDFAYAVARAVASGEAWRGVMIDGAGIGSCVVANKVPGIKAACCHNEFVARNAREHNDTNVLTLGSRVVGSEVCKEIMRVWLEALFAGGRHKQRTEKIVEVEKRFLK